MAIERVSTSENREAWLESRRGYLTASSIFTWREVDHPKWWSDKRADIVAEKWGGVEKEFDAFTQVSINHGAFSEKDIALKFEDGIGFRVETCNDMFINDDFPGIAATLDGYLHTGVMDDRGKCGPQYCQDGQVFPNLRASIEDRGTGVLELKRSVSKGWQTKVPDYYYSQVQCQLHITDLDWGVICADTIYRDGYRQYWDLRPYLIERDPSWRGILQQAGEEFLAAQKENA